MIVDPKLLKEFLTNHENYAKTSNGSTISDLLLKRGLTKTEGKLWKKHRKILTTAFRYEFFKSMVPSILDILDEILEIPEKKVQKILGTRDVEKITSEVITRIFFGIKAKDHSINGKNALDEVGYLLRQNIVYNNHKYRMLLGNWVMYLSADFREAISRTKAFRAYFGEIINQRMKNIKENKKKENNRQDLLGIFVEIAKESNEDPEKCFDTEEILDEFLTFFVAGKDTTSVLITMALYYYAKNPEWGKKLEEEINQLGEITLEGISNMKLMDAYLKECLRMVPPAPITIPRTAARDHILGDIQVKKGTLMFAMFLSNNFNEKYFKNPNEFNPGRFLEQNDDFIKDPFVYLPFSAGGRNCIG
eukprot:CAMPEP_0114603224 /NCGR_PEP_ID=MMETSP0125-20121206/25657_1 /TAXON_ID=485358 ORGANISM="Aristerostoma sp., Strain ATCC 50986" /NCGR_SAMPLE_ID=MMETSP0125 /ASSEMBLY_ACC=CAM_ASM_000245 /LENGTH=361 /DNA_ID=CAMNT_0001813867 /DNA_START=205 /DNA_END=1291 /DNA_ORIENTATION=-